MATIYSQVIASDDTGTSDVSSGGTGATNGSQGISVEVTDAPILRKFRSTINKMNDNFGTPISAFVACIGDSLELGVGIGATGLTNPCAYMAACVNNMGIMAVSTGIMGAGNAGNRRVSFDNRIVLGAGWGYNDTVATLGGGLFANSTTTNALAFSPGVTVGASLRVLYRITPGGGLFTVDVDGVTTSSNIDTDGADAIGSYTYSGGSGTTYNIKRVSGGAVEIIGFVHFNGGVNQFVFINCGLSGATVADLNVSGTWSPINVLAALNSKLHMVSLGTNDWSFNVGASTYATNLQTLFTSLVAINDVAFAAPAPANPADGTYNIPTATQRTYVDASKTVCEANNILFINQFERWTDFAEGDALGYYATDNFHFSEAGYRDIGSTRAMAVFGQIANGGLPILTRAGFNSFTTSGYQLNGTTVLASRGGTTLLSNGTSGANTTGAWNTAYGFDAVLNVGTGFNNSAFGNQALKTSGFKQGNTCIGSSAGVLVSTGSYNTILGAGTASTTLTTGSSNIIIGHGSQTCTTPAAGTNNFVNIGNGIRGYTTAVVIASGFGTSPSIVNGSTTFVFTINVGTGGVASSGVLTMPAAPVGWVVFATDIATNTTTATKMVAGTTTSVTLENQTVATGAAVAWPSGTVLRCIAMAY